MRPTRFGMTGCRSFTYAGLTIRVEAPEPHLVWLEEFLTPAFTPVSGGRPEALIVYAPDADRYDEAIGGSVRAGGELDCFALDGRWIRLPLLLGRDGGRLVWDEDAAVAYALTPRGAADRTGGAARFEILSPPSSTGVRVALMRVVRELAMRHARRGGGVFFHAAAFATGDGGVMIAGPKGAGKTSLLMYALLGGQCRFIANDRVFVDRAGRSPLLAGMPTVVSLRRDALDLFPAVRDSLARAEYDFLATLSEPWRRPWQPSSDRPVSLTPAQFCRLLDAGPVRVAPIRAIVFPRVVGQRGLTMTPLTAAETATRLAKALLRPVPSGPMEPAFAPAGWEDGGREAQQDEACRDLARAVPGFECLLGSGAFAHWDSARLVGRLADAAI